MRFMLTVCFFAFSCSGTEGSNGDGETGDAAQGSTADVAAEGGDVAVAIEDAVTDGAAVADGEETITSSDVSDVEDTFDRVGSLTSSR